MSPIEARVLRVLSELVRGFRELRVDFCVIGALAPELLLGAPPRRFTMDADVTVALHSLSEFERLKDGLVLFGFERTTKSYRLAYKDGGWVDLLPYSQPLAPGGRLELTPDLSFNMAGFNHVLASALQVDVAPGLTVPVVALPLYVLLKLVAFGDRRQQKDLAGIFHCLRHYAEGEDRRYGLDHDGDPVPYEGTTAYLVGHDGRQFHDPALVTTVVKVLDEITSPDSPAIFRLAREEGSFLAEADREALELFRWFRVGAGV